MGFVPGFLPWVLHWVLVGNVAFRVAVCVALAVAVCALAMARVRGRAWRRSVELGALVVFAVLTVAVFVLDDAVLQRWLLPLGNAGLFVVALVVVLAGQPFGREAVPAAMTWLWVSVFAAMTVLSAVPPLVDADASVRDGGGTLSDLFYWVLPFTLLGLAAVVSGLTPGWFERRSAVVDQRGREGTPHVTGPAPVPDIESATLVLDVPQDSRHDEPFVVTLHSAPAAATIDLTATGTDRHGRMWRSAARFTAPASGRVDVAVLDPVSGDWERADGGAPLWAMRFAAEGVTPELFVPPVGPWHVTVTARVERVGEVRRTVRRHPGVAGTRCSSVEIDGRPAMLVLPPGTAPDRGWPGVICFGGAEGGYESQVVTAKLLASHGFAVLAASWVDVGSPVVAVPLERFGAPFVFLAEHAEVDADRIAGMAVSRSAEGLLSAVCALPGLRCRGLVLVSPSSVTWQAIGPDGEIPDVPSWTLGGEAVPWLPVRTGVLTQQLVGIAWRASRAAEAHRPTVLRLRPAYESGLRGPTTGAADARIPGERADCPLLLVTGTEDAVWPSGPMAQEVLGRRLGAGDEHLSCLGAGHLIRLGVLPTDVQWTGGFALGGSRAGQAAAQRRATEKILTFLASVTATPTAAATP